jgi:hypothetical protein
MSKPGRILYLALTAMLFAALSACSGPGSTISPDHEPGATATPGSPVPGDPATFPRELMFFDYTTGLFVSMVVDPLDRDFGHVFVAVDGAGVAWSLEPGRVDLGADGGLTYTADGPGKFAVGAVPDPVQGPNYASAGAWEEATLAVSVIVQPDLMTATGTATVNGTAYTFASQPPSNDGGQVAEEVNAALVTGNWLTIWEHLDAAGQAKFTPDHWGQLGAAFESEFDSIDSAEVLGVRYLVQPGILPFRAFADTIVETTTGDARTTWAATQELVYERGAWRVHSMGQMQEML